MKLGFVSAILPDLEFDEVIRFASETGYDCVEIMCWPKGKAERRYAGVTHIDVVGFTKSDADAVNEKLAQDDITLSGLGYYPNPLAPDASEANVAIDHIKEVIKAAELLGLQNMNTFIGKDWSKSVDDNWPQFKKVWPDLIKFAEDHGIKVGIENCPMHFTKDEWPGGKNLAATPEIWQRMFDEIPSDYFGLNFDPSHLIWQHIDVFKAVRDFADKIFHAHAKDVRLDKHRLDQVGIMAHPLQYHTPKLPGLGEVDWGKFISVLGDTGYDGPVCVEVEDRSFEGSLERRQASLVQSVAYLRQFIA
ncbi:TIM barrel protein [candidate division KSB1 bacterium]|nr:TIM barrel protein [candidate division KSB1 bacterium]